MTPELTELARRVVACPRWRWMPGMRLECGDILLWSDDQHWHCCGDNQNWIRWRHDRIGQAERGSLPDLTDPATLGCLLALVREAWKSPVAQVSPSLPDGYLWTCYINDEAEDRLFREKTEAEALVAALEAAP